LSSDTVKIPERYKRIIDALIHAGEFADANSVVMMALDTYFRLTENKIRVAVALMRLGIPPEQVKLMIDSQLPGSPRITAEAVKRAKEIVMNHWEHLSKKKE